MRIAIIGGGIYGTAVAYFLDRLGADDVVLFDKNSIGGVSTSRSAGIVRHHYGRRDHIRLANRGREIIQQLEHFTGQPGGFHQNGYLALTGSDDEPTFREIVRKQQDLGLDVEFVDPDDLEKYIDAIDTSGVAAAALEREAGFADPYLVAQAFARAARRDGVEMKPDTEVVGIQQEGETVTALETGAGRESVDYVVNAAGPWGAEIGEMVDVEIPLTWYESKVVVLSTDVPYDLETPTLSDATQSMYAKPEPGGDFLVGGVDRPRVDRALGLEGVTIEYLQTIQAALEKRLPRCADAEVVDTWSGIITASPDWYQIVGVPEGLENFYNVVGGSGHGFKEAPGFAESIAHDILGRAPEVDLSPYRLERFVEGEQIGDMEMQRKKND
jgi:sarcosine oxidase subunit beta